MLGVSNQAEKQRVAPCLAEVPFHGGAHTRAVVLSLVLQGMSCHSLGGCPSREPRAGRRSVSKRQEEKVPSVSLRQMLHRDDGKSL